MKQKHIHSIIGYDFGILSALKIAPLSKSGKVFLLLSSVFGALLELAGLAIFVPLLLLLLEENGIGGNKYLKFLYQTIGIQNYGSFLLVVILLVLLVTIIKNVVLHFLSNYRSSLMLGLYSDYSRHLFFNYYSRGLLFIKNSSPNSLSHNVNAVCFQYVFGYLNPSIILVGDLLLSGLIILSLAFINVYIAAIELIIFVPLFMVYHIKIGKKLQNAGRIENEAKKRQWQVTTETFRGYAEVVINDYFPTLSRGFEKGISAVSKSRMHVESLKSLTSRSIEVLVILMMVGVVVGYYFFAGKSADFQLLMGIFAAGSLRLLPAVRSIMAQHATLRNNHYTRDIIRETVLADANLSLVPVAGFTFSHSIELKNISFDFGPDRPIFKNLSMTIQHGERVGICGVSGSGKSTLLYLLMGLYEPQEGAILIDGIQLTPENRKGWHKLLGYVSQDVFIMDGTLGQNISPAEFKDSKLIEQSIEVAALKDLTAKLTNGLDTRIGEGGSRISGGERQRIGIARAHFKGAEVLLMDEPTSSLDASTEEAITETLGQQLLFKNRTIILISHSESLLSKCDRVIDFEKLEGVIR